MKEFKLFPLLIMGLLFVACNNDDDATTVEQIEEPIVSESVTLDNEINDFIWKGLNHWYFWQGDVADLADSKDDNENDYHTYLNGFDSPKSLFDDLIYTQADDFSWYIEDVDEQLNSFRGITKSFGLNLGFLVRVNENSDDVVIYVTYVTPDSPAAEAGIKRGDLIYRVDGVNMTATNYQVVNNIFSNEAVSIGLGTIANGQLTPSGEDISLSAIELTTNPIHYSNVLEIQGKKIGYLVYTGFKSTFNGELNDVFGNFKTENIDELVLDLRYNGGGSILTSALLASMIYGEATAEQDVFAALRYNAKRNPTESFTFPFLDEVYLYDKATSEFSGTTGMNRLSNVSKLYVIASTRTASASEMIINGLRPYIDVEIIGETTVGKNEGSITVVDSPGVGDNAYSDLNNRNPNHSVGMQPIVLQVFNSLNQSDYTNGFEPDILVEEFRYANNILPFGDPNEIMLSTVLDQIFGSGAKNKFELISNDNISKINSDLKLPKFTNEMYLGPNEEIFLH